MDRQIEKDKTYRIPHKDGTDLLQVLSLGEPLKVKNLKTGKIQEMSKQSFQKRLNAGEIYVSADLKEDLDAIFEN